MQSQGQRFHTGIHVSFALTVCYFISYVNVFPVYLSHFVFFHIWDLGYNSSEFILAMLHLLFQVFTKVFFESWYKIHFLQCSVLMSCSCSSFRPDNYESTMIEWLPCPCVEIASDYSYCISRLHRPMVLCFVSTNFINSF